GAADLFELVELAHHLLQRLGHLGQRLEQLPQPLPEKPPARHRLVVVTHKYVERRSPAYCSTRCRARPAPRSVQRRAACVVGCGLGGSRTLTTLCWVNLRSVSSSV